MSYKVELAQIIDECFTEVIKDSDTSEDDILAIELIKEAVVYEMSQQIISEKDEKFVSENLPLYKRLIMAMLTGDETETMKVALEFLKLRNAE